MDKCRNSGYYEQKLGDLRDRVAELEQGHEEFAKFLHYPECWDTAAYPTLDDAILEALAWTGCSVCKAMEADNG